MFIRTKQRAGRTQFFLCIAEQGGNAGSAKRVEYSVCLGETLGLSADEWVETLDRSPTFQAVALKDVLEAAERYAAENDIAPEKLAGLRQAARGAKRSRRAASSERRWPEDQRAAALSLLGLAPGASERAIESAFRKAARRCHPDAGGDPEKFRALVGARDLLLGRNTQAGEIS